MNNNNQSVAVELLRSNIRLRTVENFIFEKIKVRLLIFPFTCQQVRSIVLAQLHIFQRSRER